MAESTKDDLQKRLDAIPDEEIVKEDSGDKQPLEKQKTLKGLSWLIRLLREKKQEYSFLKRVPFNAAIAILIFVNEVYWFFKGLIIVSWVVTRTYWQTIRGEYKKRKYKSTRFLMLMMHPFTILMPVLPTFIIVSTVCIILASVDQLSVYDETVSTDFTGPIDEVAMAAQYEEEKKKVKKKKIDLKIGNLLTRGTITKKYIYLPENLHVGQKGARMFRASYHQLERMLDRFPYWTVNDPWFYVKGFWDNSLNTQYGVWYGSKEMARILSSRITRYGTGDDQHPLALDGAQDLAVKPDVWKMEMAPSEEFYRSGIEKLKQFEALAEADANMVNIRADDLVFILHGIKNDVLGEAYGKLTKPSEQVPWSEVDDIVKYARGVAIVARDQLTVIRHQFTKEIARGGIDNLDIAIQALNGAVNFHPFYITKGPDDSQIGDHRAKLSRYYSEAFRRIEEFAKSLET